ncbi:MAG: SufB/SufD family protein [Alphaproteobacteria bacterium]
MDNISNSPRDDSVSFYKDFKGLKSGKTLLPIIANHTPQPITKENHIIAHHNHNDITITGDSTIILPDNITADIFISLSNDILAKGVSAEKNLSLSPLYITILAKPESRGNIFWQNLPLTGVIKVDYHLAKNTLLNGFAFLALEHILRFQQTIYLDEEYSIANLFVAGKNHRHPKQSGFADSTMRAVHHASHSQSQMAVRGVVDNQEVMLAQVRTDIAVDKTAADTAQDIKAIILSPEAKFYGKPELNIKHDKVKAKHGLSVGALDDEQIYYLRSRGIDEKTARQLLLNSFFMGGLHYFFSDDLQKAEKWLTPFLQSLLDEPKK